MNISFQTLTGQKTSHEPILSGMDADGRIVSGPSRSDSVNKDSYLFNLDGTGFTKDAYGAHARSAEDISQMAQDTDVRTRHNYMALLSNTMSPEDFAKAAEDGFDIKNMNSEETVTIVDKIKSVLLEAGCEIIGYNDDLSLDKLSKITGSESFARSIKSSFNENDIPLTSDNVKAARQAYDQVEEVKELDDSAVKFMVLNNMRPTMENVYFASHSTNGQNVSERGFYAQEGGYMAQKADSFKWDQLAPQIDKVIAEAGLDPAAEENQENAKWMVIQGIPLTAENLERLDIIKGVEIPVTTDMAAKAAAAAIADGKRAIEGDLSDPNSNLQKAERLVEDVAGITDQNIQDTIASGRMLNIRNLTSSFHMEAAQEMAAEVNDNKLVLARIQLEEVRLQMTVEANKQLLDSGFSIDTAPMEDLIARLRATLGNMGDEAAGKSVDEITKVTPVNSTYIASMTLSRVNIIKEGPADIVGEMADSLESASLFKISETSETMTRRFREAGEGYEKLMTAPRADLGDSITKAFRNVDDILKDLGKELSDENRRVMRILGYNRMEIDEENFEKVRALDVKLQTTVSRLKPGAVLDLIREGKNPLSMTIDELSQSLDQNSSSDKENKGKSEERYARFLYKLEKKGGIAEEEKKSFIGIYRLFHTLKTTDYQAIGSVLKTGRDMTIGNLLDATRTQNASRRGMDYIVDDDFGGLEAKETSSERIDFQINTAFTYYKAKAQVVYENLEPEKLMAAKPTPQTLLPELAEELAAAESDKELDAEYLKQELGRIRQTAALKATEPALDEMRAADIEVTYNNLEAMISNRRDRRTGNIWDKAGSRQEQKEIIDKMDQDDFEENYVKILDDFSDKLSEEIMTGNDSYIDVRAISLMQKQLSVMGRAAENGSFDVPVEVEGQVVSMHVTLKADAAAGSRMDASVQTDEYGLITASLFIEKQVLRGMLTTSNGKNPEEAEYLENVRQRMCDSLAGRLKDAGVDHNNVAILYHTQSLPATAGGTITDAREGNTFEKTETRTLLTMAKAFIEAL